MARPKQRLLSRQKIVESAIQLIDDIDAEHFSIYKLARVLNVKSPSIYYYYKDRDELLAAVCMGILQEIRIPRRRSQKWIDWVLQDGVAYYRAVGEHPNVAALLLRRKWRFWAADRLEAAIERMTEAGISPSDALTIIDCIEGMALSWAAFKHTNETQPTFENLDKLAYPKLDEARRKQKLDEASYRRTLEAYLVGMDQLYAKGNNR